MLVPIPSQSKGFSVRHILGPKDYTGEDPGMWLWTALRILHMALNTQASPYALPLEAHSWSFHNFLSCFNLLRDASMSSIHFTKWMGRWHWSALQPPFPKSTDLTRRRRTKHQRRMFYVPTVSWCWGAASAQLYSSQVHIPCWSHISEVKGRSPVRALAERELNLEGGGAA